LFLGKSTKTAATRAALFDSNMHQIGFAPDPTGGAYSAPTDPLAVVKGPASKRRGRGEDGMERRGRRNEGGAWERIYSNISGKWCKPLI